MDVFFNDLSFIKVNSEQEAKEKFDNLCHVVCNLKNEIELVRTDFKFKNSELFPNYSFIKWFAHPDLEMLDMKSLMMKKIADSPYTEEMIEESERDKSKIYEFSHNGEGCMSLGLASALLFDSIAISIHHTNWSLAWVMINVYCIDQDGESSFQTNVRHISTPVHIDSHMHWLSKQNRPIIKSGRQLWMNRASLFPHVKFCESVRSQIDWLKQGHPELNQIVKRLNELNDFCLNWQEGTTFDSNRFSSKVDPESQTRLSDFKNELTIKCPDGLYRLFSWHMRYTPGAGRIHFHEDSNRREILVGSIANQNYIK